MLGLSIGKEERLEEPMANPISINPELYDNLKIVRKKNQSYILSSTY